MALKIRMSRGGAKKRPFYRIVVADSRMPRDGRYIEKLGTYNPLLPKDHDDRLTLDLERAKHWISQGAKPSDRIARFLDDAGLWKREARNNPQKGKPGAKALERLEAAEEAKRAAEEEAAAAAEAPALLLKRLLLKRLLLKRLLLKRLLLKKPLLKKLLLKKLPADEEAPADEEPADDASDEEGEKDA